MIVVLDLNDAAMILQSLEAMDWTYCGEGGRAKLLREKIITAVSKDSQRDARRTMKKAGLKP